MLSHLVPYSFLTWTRQSFKTTVVFGSVPFWTAGLCVNAYVLSVLYAPCSTVRTLLLLYLPYCLLDRSPQTGRGAVECFCPSSWREKWIRHAPNFHWVAEYFPVRLHKTAELPTIDNTNTNNNNNNKQAYLFCYHPHGVISMGANAALSTNGCNFDQVFPGLQRKGVTLNLMFQLPFFREYILATGYVSANKETMQRHLRNGCSLVLIPGGAAEALHAHPESMELVARRRGFVQLAYECQIPLVPCLGFGENRVFSTYIPPDDRSATTPNGGGSTNVPLQHRQGSSGWNEASLSFLARTVRSLQRAWCRWTTFSVPLLTSLVPHASPIDVVVGAPVMPPAFPSNMLPSSSGSANDNDDDDGNTDQAVEGFHQRYWQAVQALYEEHKSKYGYQDIPLVLL